MELQFTRRVGVFISEDALFISLLGCIPGFEVVWMGGIHLVGR